MQKLVSNLLIPGTKFVVTEDVKESTFGPGTTGFLSYMKNSDSDYEDVANVVVSIIRRGKGGKRRLDVSNMSIPIFSDPRMLEHKNYLPIGRRHYVHIERIDFDTENLMEIIPMDFLGWVAAYSRYLNYLVQHVAKPKKGLWPNDPHQTLNIGMRLPDIFLQNEEETIATLTNEAWRQQFIGEARAKESALIKCALRYNQSVVKTTLNSAQFVEYTNEEYYEVSDKDLATATVKFYKDKAAIVKEMMHFRKKNNK
jgi:hypothetical protein